MPPALAADGLFLPAAPTGPGGEDSITTSTGIRCSQSINSNGAYLDMGVVGGGLNAYLGEDSGIESSAIGYARVVVPLGRRPERLDCNEIYALEVQRLKEEIRLLKIGLE
jgi:hypothetical protein